MGVFSSGKGRRGGEDLEAGRQKRWSLGRKEKETEKPGLYLSLLLIPQLLPPPSFGGGGMKGVRGFGRMAYTFSVQREGGE